MSEAIELTCDEVEVLLMARREPLLEDCPRLWRTCMNLQARRLLQPAGQVGRANGWAGSPHALVLSRAGWNCLKHTRRQPGSTRG